jgi:hypothetical protein
MLQDQDRKKLDSIVQQMIKNKESDATIQTVVNDFKQKYDRESVEPIKTEAKKKGIAESVAGFAGDIVRDITKPIVATPVRVAQAIESIRTGLDAPTVELPFWGKFEQPKSFGEVFGTGAKAVSAGLGPVSGGAAFFGGQAAEEGKGIKDVALSAGGGAAFGKITKAAGSAISKMPETAWSAILKRTPTMAVKNPQLEKYAAQQGITGITRNQISGTLGKKIQQIELQVDDILSSKTEKINTWPVVEKLRELHEAYSSIPGEKEATNTILNVANEVLSKGKTIGVQEANQLKRNIYGVVSKTYGKGLLEIPAKGESQKMIARGLKEEIEKAIPEMKSLNQRQAVLIQMKKAIDATIARQTGKGVLGTGVGLFDLMIGGGFGIGINPMFGLAMAGAKKTAESSAVLSSSGLALQKLINIWNKMSPTQKILFYNGLKGIGNQTINSSNGKNQ